EGKHSVRNGSNGHLSQTSAWPSSAPNPPQLCR
ncbi:hypothetical protein HaLaN_33117, partial [Haematococcus lacustris]